MIIQTTIKQRDGKYRSIGLFDTESKVWLVERNKHKHYMKILKGWGLDNWMYELLKNKYRMERVVLTETTSHKVFQCRVPIIEKEKIYKTFHPHRLQIFIPKLYWGMIDNGKK